MRAAVMTRRATLLIDRLPQVRGSYTAEAPMKDLTWFRVGGPAEVLFRPADLDDLMLFMAYRPMDAPVTFIGAGANLLVRDGGIPGIVIRLGKGFNHIEDDARGLRVGAGCSNVSVALRARDRGLKGYEFLRGVPGTIGGALRMNAGAYGQEMKDIVLAARWVRGDGLLQWSSVEELGYGYRHCSLPEDRIFVEAMLRAEPGDREAIRRRMDEISAERTTTQPVKTSTGGSTFANPPAHKAWELIDRAGCRGLVIGDAQVSEQHCNFLINRGAATAADLETLGETVRERVKAATGIELRWEIRRIGVAGGARS
ncbi:UDP-N-acetylenolpyruvoylglucosamine reductase [Minwuia thermotolerans]|uniref:UDP-N-acetylenolpyruvoylglucosamine reductase n=2 Tax=Minwuia thermotolerans TaxID=2056226 RepID=A0A2M9G259_9PROT|nr:UDP-N-acetylenolpyruvoylglucosamine reductase [Minwuia thermotolerans]